MTDESARDDDHPVILGALGPLHPAFSDRLDALWPRLHRAAMAVFGAGDHLRDSLTRVLTDAHGAWVRRPIDLKVRGARLSTSPLASERTVGAVCFVDRYAGNLVGIRDDIDALRAMGVTQLHLLGLFPPRTPADADVPSIDPGIGSLQRLSDVSADLHLGGISVAVDLPPRDGADPARAVADALTLANSGVDLLRIAPDDHDAAVLELTAAVLALAAPGVRLVALTDDDSLSGDAVPLRGDAGFAALLWEGLARRDARSLRQALVAADGIGAGQGADGADGDGVLPVRWVRNEELLTWADVARASSLTRFFSGDAPRSFAAGVAAGDRAIAGTTASLAGIETGDRGGVNRVILAHALLLAARGVPLLYLGDEVAQLNDPTYLDDPGRRDDPRWAHRGNRPRDQYARRANLTTPAGAVYARMLRLLAARRRAPEFAAREIVEFPVTDPAVVAFIRPGTFTSVLVLANLSDHLTIIPARALAAFAPSAHDLYADEAIDLRHGFALPAHAFAWLRVTPAPGASDPAASA